MIGYKAIVVSKFYEQSIVHSIRKVTKLTADTGASHYDDDEIAYFTVRWKTRASFVYHTKNVDNNDKDSKNRKRSH